MLIDPVLVDQIFYKVPEILAHHEQFLSALIARIGAHVEHFDHRQNIGDIILNNVSDYLFDN